MHSITAAMIGERLYEIGRRCNHPFLDSVGGVVVTGIDTTSPIGCTALAEVTFDDGTKITAALSQAILCWQPTSDGVAADTNDADGSPACQVDAAPSPVDDSPAADAGESTKTSPASRKKATCKKTTKRKSAKKASQAPRS